MAEGLRLPVFWDRELWEVLPVNFEPGKYYLPIGAVEISEERQINVSSPEFGAGLAAPHLIRGLFSHLRTADSEKFQELEGDKGKLFDLQFKANQYSEKGLELLKIMADEVTGYHLPVVCSDEEKNGLTKWFVILAWNDAIQKAITNRGMISESWYRHSQTSSGSTLWKLNCGGKTIGYADDDEALKTFENWHKKLRIKYSTSQLGKNIAAKDLEATNLVQEVRGLLQEFSDMEPLPGHCEL
jgi:hypothetical protein